ncbi:xanthine dehydrogenase subunit XdhA [Proteiniclasticum sp. QWL-01]|uniref:xanthine dehydrogenase subunit XdhA n=1 Tax=Proteiniclasticum sp. QWL-01 TaxID=3036945 RepID=UPI0024104705|nr:xanthine dehydrogenase subunit XdhA [Proteiniclasticum sp. QWL-01]WFF72799.1 xanthine dehydrogenase molybdenum-binding subunit XdhA [Proteiniclasticum sp. QWL-01]
MTSKVVGTSQVRKDAVDKVTGAGQYTDDFFIPGLLTGRLVHSPHAHARVVRVNKEKALALPGVVAVICHTDLPDVKYPTAGHPYSLDPSHRDVADRKIFADVARYVGDIVAGVVAEDELTARRAAQLVEVEYEVLPFVLDPRQAMADGAPQLHEGFPRNVLASFGNTYGDTAAFMKEAAHCVDATYSTNIVQHAQMENQTATAHVDSHGRIVITSSTQIPHIARRIVGQALDLPWGQVQVIKPYIGGGFGNKQDVIAEPIVAAMTLKCGGRPVRLTYDREEVFTDTRTRHAVEITFHSCLDASHKLLATHVEGISNNGSYASHGHSIIMAATSKFRPLYHWQAFRIEPKTVYTNLPTAGAMRGYGAPQMTFALECHMDDLARQFGLDPIDFRRHNLVRVGYEDPVTHNRVASFGIPECIRLGMERYDWTNRRRALENQTGSRRRGLGMALFSYGSGTFPAGLEISGARISLNQDGSATLMVGATEIGQGADTVFAQMAAETMGISYDKVHVRSTQDTDLAPFDTGAYASRQTYIVGFAIHKAATQVRDKILKVASRMTGRSIENLDTENDQVVDARTGEPVISIADVSLNAYYDLMHAEPITADVSNNARINTFSYGATFCEIEVDLRTGKIEVLDITNFHDCGTVINPKTAEGQVLGGMHMGIGQALTEDLKFDPATGRCQNPNLLDYKIGTAMDNNGLHCVFVDSYDPTAPYGQKSLGEPPTLSPAPAIRNALLHATGVAMNSLPLSQQRVFEAIKAAGLLMEKEEDHA